MSNNKLYVVLCLCVSIVILLEVSGTTGHFHRKQNVDFYWRDYDGTIPSDALQTPNGVYIASITVEKCANVPGTFYPHRQEAVTSAWGKKVTAKSNFRILCTTEPHRFRWKPVRASSLQGEFLSRCLRAGYEDDSDQYVGKILHEGEWKIAKAFPVSSRFNGLKAWYNAGTTYTASEFEILVFD